MEAPRNRLRLTLHAGCRGGGVDTKPAEAIP